MRVIDLANTLDLEIVAGNNRSGNEVTWGYTSDLLSDVMGNSEEGNVWITMQTHLNVVAVSTLKVHAAILFVAGNRPAQEVIDKANEEGIPLLCTGMTAFEVSGKLYALLSSS